MWTFRVQPQQPKHNKNSKPAACRLIRRAKGKTTNVFNNQPGGMETEDYLRARATFDAQALGADGNAAVGADFECRANTPYIRPPRAARGRAQDRPLFLFGKITGLFRSPAQFAMGFVGVAMESQSVDVWVASTGPRSIERAMVPHKLLRNTTTHAGRRYLSRLGFFTVCVLSLKTLAEYPRPKPPSQKLSFPAHSLLCC
jgi:hypothetical protein